MLEKGSYESFRACLPQAGSRRRRGIRFFLGVSAKSRSLARRGGLGMTTDRLFAGCSGVRMGFVVNVHQLAGGGVRIFLCGGKRLMAEQVLNRAEAGAVGQQMGVRRRAQRVR